MAKQLSWPVCVTERVQPQEANGFPRTFVFHVSKDVFNLFQESILFAHVLCGSQESNSEPFAFTTKLFAGLRNAIPAFLETMSHYMPPINKLVMWTEMALYSEILLAFPPKC